MWHNACLLLGRILSIGAKIVVHSSNVGQIAQTQEMLQTFPKRVSIIYLSPCSPRNIHALCSKPSRYITMHLEVIFLVQEHPDLIQVARGAHPSFLCFIDY